MYLFNHSLFLAAFAFGGIFNSGIAFGWGPNGHRIVAQIAENHLTPTAKKTILQILDRRSLARVSTFADEIRADETSDFSALHFVNIPDGLTYAQAPKNPKGDVITAIQSSVDKLTSQSTSKDEKAFYLKMLVHFVGDIHQPLHAGYPNDKGGNACMVVWFGRMVNLHSVWDSGMIDSAKLSYSEYSKFLEGESNASDLVSWQKDNVLTWVEESRQELHRLYPDSIASPVIDGEISSSEESSQGKTEKSRTPTYTYCKKSSSEKIPKNLMPKLSYKYLEKFKSVYERRLLQAGARLAGVLNSIFDSDEDGKSTNNFAR